MFGQLYDRALDGERCWVRHDDGRVRKLPVRSWLGGRGADPALGVDLSATAVKLARTSGAPALRRDVFEPLPGTGRWQTVLLADGNVGLGGDPIRVLRRAAELLCSGGRCVAEFDSGISGIDVGWVRLESSRTIGPWFRWASVGIDYVPTLAAQVGLAVSGVYPIGRRVVASLAAT